MFKLAYRSMRRLSILDMTRLLHLGEGQMRDQPLADGYLTQLVGPEQLTSLIRDQRVAAQVGSPESLQEDRCQLIAAFAGDRVASFVWMAQRLVSASENYSRAAHLGTSIHLPDETTFIYNAWTDPEHRGKRLIAALLCHVVRKRVAGTRSLLTSIDWTNRRSLRAFEHLGMRNVGTVLRIGRGAWQMSFVPKLVPFDVRVAEDAPGWKWAL